MPLIFVDETGINPLPAGIQVSLYRAGVPQNASSLVGQAWTEPGGTCAIDVMPALTYVAVFFGGQTPPIPQTFGGAVSGTTTVTVAQYRSPSFSVQGYAQEGCAVLPAGWFSTDVALKPGGVAYAIMYGLGAVMQAQDSMAQYVLSKMRLQSSQGADIDSWAADFLGRYLPRFQNESDTVYIARIIAFLQCKPAIQAGLQQVVVGFYNAIALELAQAYAGNLTYDYSGGYGTQGGYDTAQGFTPKLVLPSVLVWDRQDHPALADQFNINPTNDDGSFVIQIGFNPPNTNAWYLDHSHLDFETFLVDDTTYSISQTAPDPRLAQMVNLLKANGTKPIYITSVNNA